MAVNHPLSPGGITHALLDTNFLLPPRLSDVLFDMCLQGLFSARWTVDIEAEFLRNWPRVVAKQRKGGSSPSSQQATVEQAKAARRLACYKGLSPSTHERRLLDALILHGAKNTAQHFAAAWGVKLPSKGPTRRSSSGE